MTIDTKRGVLGWTLSGLIGVLLWIGNGALRQIDDLSKRLAAQEASVFAMRERLEEDKRRLERIEAKIDYMLELRVRGYERK